MNFLKFIVPLLSIGWW